MRIEKNTEIKQLMQLLGQIRLKVIILNKYL